MIVRMVQGQLEMALSEREEENSCSSQATEDDIEHRLHRIPAPSVARRFRKLE
jgi:hypothetical protein